MTREVEHDVWRLLGELSSFWMFSISKISLIEGLAPNSTLAARYRRERPPDSLTANKRLHAPKLG